MFLTQRELLGDSHGREGQWFSADLFARRTMKLSLQCLFAAAGLLVASAGFSRADDVDLAPKFDPFAPPEITLVGHCTDGCNSGCTDGCNSGCNSGCADGCGNSCCSSRHVGRDFMVCTERCGGWVGNLEFLMLQPFGGVQSFPDLGLGANPAQLNYNPSYRFTFGRENAEGFGARIRYFEFDRSSSSINGGVGVEARYIDAELTQSTAFRRWNTQFSGGVRYAQYESSLDVLGTAISTGFNGFGLTAGVRGTRDLNRSGSLQVVAAGRYSGVYGNSSIGLGIAPFANLKISNDLVNIFELNIGPQWRRRLAGGGYLTVGAGLESQFWMGAIPLGGLVGTIKENVGFAGFSTSIGLTR